jgi:2-C-methyl-D-erythritol 4-phosphate cytidylyltransferase
MPLFTAILPAAGSSTRFGPGRDKLRETLLGKTILQRSVDAFLERDDVAAVVIPSREQVHVSGDRIIQCAGGATRAHSVLEGLKASPAHVEWVAIHDAARPLVSQDLIDNTLAAAIEHGAAVPAMAVHLTIKQAVGPLPAKVQRTIPRQELWAMQTPQILRRQALLDAFARSPIPLDQITDDTQLIELAGGEVWLVPGEERNLKITTAADLRLADMYLRG